MTRVFEFHRQTRVGRFTPHSRGDEIYGIPKVMGRDSLAFDRHGLTDLSFANKFNGDYCAYANGILAYFTEIAARAEQY